MKYFNHKNYRAFGGVAIISGLLFVTAPVAFALSESTEIGNALPEVTLSPQQMDALKKAMQADAQKIDGAKTEQGSDEGEVNARALGVPLNLELHVDLEEEEGDIGRPGVLRANQVRTSDDFKVFVRSTAKRDAHVKSVNMKEGKVNVEYAESAKLFGLIGTTINARVSADTKGDVTVSYPWYHIFMKKTHSSASLQSAIARAIAGERKAEQEGIASTTAQTTITIALGIADIFEIIANTLKDVSVKK